MVEIMDKPPLSIRRELDAIVLQEVRADLKALHRPDFGAKRGAKEPFSLQKTGWFSLCVPWGCVVGTAVQE